MPKGIYLRNYDGKYTIDSNGCWLWKGYIEKNGYGSRLAHRRLYKRYKGEIPKEYQIDHLCKVKACVNPDHLEVVTAAENIHRSAVAKLTIEDIKMIRLLKDKYTQKELGSLFRVHQCSIGRIINNKRWEVADLSQKL